MLVGRFQVVQKDGPGNSVDRDVVDDDQQPVMVLARAVEQHHPQEWAFNQVQAALRVPGRPGHHLIRLGGVRWQADHLQQDVVVLAYEILKPAVLAGFVFQPQPQSVVVVDQCWAGLFGGGETSSRTAWL